MNEDLLHFIWKFQLFDHSALQTQEGAPVMIQKTGFHNHDAGPDFMDARIKIDDTLWAGNVEIHIKASDWYHHQHHKDAAYGNVILHVVLENDLPGTEAEKHIAHLPCLELKDRVSTALFSKYHQLKENQQWIPCADQIGQVSKFTVKHWLNRILIERIEEKSDRLYQLLEANHNDWRETFYQLLARNFGFKVNAEPFERLAKEIGRAHV